MRPRPHEPRPTRDAISACPYPLPLPHHISQCQLTPSEAMSNIFMLGVAHYIFGFKRLASSFIRPWQPCAEPDNDPIHRTNSILGGARLHAHRRPGYLALRRQYALPRADHTARRSFYSRLRHGSSRARQSSGRSEWRSHRYRHPASCPYFPDPLPLGSHSGHPVFFAPLFTGQQISFLQFPLQVPGP
jgi:hypothetical protein